MTDMVFEGLYDQFTYWLMLVGLVILTGVALATSAWLGPVAALLLMTFYGVSVGFGFGCVVLSGNQRIYAASWLLRADRQVKNPLTARRGWNKLRWAAGKTNPVRAICLRDFLPVMGLWLICAATAIPATAIYLMACWRIVFGTGS